MVSTIHKAKGHEFDHVLMLITHPEHPTDDKQLDKLEQYEGEAYFARALAYSELIKCFCKAYDSDEQAEKEPASVRTFILIFS